MTAVCPSKPKTKYEIVGEWLRMRLVWVLSVSGEVNQHVNVWTMPTLAGIGVLSGWFSF